MTCDQSDSTNKLIFPFPELDTEQHWHPMQLPLGKGGAQSQLTASQDCSLKRKPLTGNETHI